MNRRGDEFVIAREEMLRDREDAIRHKGRSEEIDRVVDKREQHRNGKDSRQRNKRVTHMRLVPENKHHKEGQAGMPREEQAGLEVEIRVHGVEESVSGGDVVRMDAHMSKGDEEGAYHDEERDRLEGEENRA